jgi:hypothetical protein
MELRMKKSSPGFGRIAAVGASLAASLLLATQAQAVPLTVTGWEYPGNVTMATITNQNPATSYRVYAGGFDTTGPGGQTFTSWCTDIFQNTYFNSPNNDFVLRSAADVLGAARAASLSKLATLAYSQVNNSSTSGAFQLAIWEIVNETLGNPLSLGTGNFRATSITNGSGTIAQNWLNGLANVASIYTVNIWFNPNRQDLAVFELVPVSEPAALAIVLVGLGAATLVLVRRRRSLAVDSRRN